MGSFNCRLFVVTQYAIFFIFTYTRYITVYGLFLLMPMYWLVYLLQIKYSVVRFLALVTTMVTMVDHGNHRSNDHGNDRSNHRGYYDRYYNVNA